VVVALFVDISVESLLGVKRNFSIECFQILEERHAKVKLKYGLNFDLFIDQLLASFICH